MAWYNIFSSSSKAVDTASNLIGGVVDGIDAVILTEEEKIKFDLKRAELWLKVQETITGESSIRSITRRVLAVSFISVYLTLIIASAIVWQFSPEQSKHIFETAQTLNTPIITIIIFYFGYYAVSNVIKAKKE